MSRALGFALLGLLAAVLIGVVAFVTSPLVAAACAAFAVVGTGLLVLGVRLAFG